MPQEIIFSATTQSAYLLFPWLIIAALLIMTYRLSRNASQGIEFDASHTVLDNPKISDPFVSKISMRKVAQLIFALTAVYLTAWVSPSLHSDIEFMPLYLHTIMEIFSIIVSAMFFAIVWHTYKIKHTVNMLILACAFFAGGLIDLAHLLSYKGMPDFISPSSVEKGIIFWLFARFIIAVGIFTFVVKDWNPLLGGVSRYRFLFVTLIVSGIVYYLGIFHLDIFPHTFIDGYGLTEFKLDAEYVIMFILLVSSFLFCRKILQTNSYESIGLFTAIVIMILGELYFVSYDDACDLFGLLGHIYKVLAYYLVYQSAFVTRVRWPFWRISQEILSRKKSEEELNKKKERLDAIFDTMNMGIVIIDNHGVIVDCNFTAAQLLGIAKEEYLSHGIANDEFTAYRPDMSLFSKGERPVAMVLERREPVYNTVMGIEKRDGSLLWITLDAVPLEDKSVLVTFGDITKLRDTEDKQKEQEKLLMQQAKLAAMGEMVGAIAHQWRQPLNVISYTTMNLGLQHKFGSLTEESLTKMLVNIDTQTQKMSSIISDFLGFFKPHKIKEEFFIVDAFNTVLDMMERQLANKNIKIAMCVDENRRFYGFKNELEQVILNIIVNARDAFTNKKELANRRIAIDIRHKAHQINIFIRDNAGGIDKGIINRVFEPYFTTKGDGEGTGIGLYMSKLIMQRSFDGDVVALNIEENGLVVGAEFELTINNSVAEEK